MSRKVSTEELLELIINTAEYNRRLSVIIGAHIPAAMSAIIELTNEYNKIITSISTEYEVKLNAN